MSIPQEAFIGVADGRGMAASANGCRLPVATYEKVGGSGGVLLSGLKF